MSRGRREVGLAVAFVGTIGLIGLPHRSAQLEDLRAEQPPGTVVAVSDTSTSTTTTTPTTAPPVSTTAAPLERSLDVVSYPTAASASLTLTDATGRAVEAEGAWQGRISGEVELEIQADGYRSEAHVIPAGQGGTFEVFLDPADQVVDRTMVFTTGSAPKQVAFSPDGSELWVTLLAGSGLEVYDPSSGELLSEIDLPEAGSVEVIFNRSGDTAWVSQMETARVYEIDADTHRIRRELETGGSWSKVMALSPDEDRLWASNWVSNDVSEFDLTTGELIRRIPTVTTPRGLTTDSDGENLYVAGYDSGEIEVIDLETGESEVIHHTGGAMRHLVLDSETGTIFASDMALDTVFSVDTSTNTVEEFVATDRLPNTIDLSPDGSILAVSNRGANNPETYYQPGPEWGSVLLFDTHDGRLLDAVVGGNQPTGLDVSPGGDHLAYSDFLDNRVTVLAVPSVRDLRKGDGGRAESYRAELRK